MAPRRLLPLVLLAACRHGSAVQAPPAPQVQAVSFEREVAPVLGQYCFRCHGNGKKKGDLALDAFKTSAQAAADRKTWETVLEQIQTHTMPPEDERQPSPRERQLLARWIESEVLKCDCSRPDPGRVTVRRLNRAEYNNTIRDLVGVDFGPADEFPVDNSGFGFDTIADALSVSPGLAEKYLAAAHKVLNAALHTPELHKVRVKKFPVDLLEVGYNARQTGDGWALLNSFEEDDVAASHEVPFESEYLVRVRAYAFQDPHAPGKYARDQRHLPVKLTFMLDDRVIDVVEVAASAEFPALYDVRVVAPPGRHRFRTVVRRLKDWMPEAEARKWKSGPQQKGSVAVEYLEVEGPLGADRRPLPATHARLFFAPPAAGREREAAQRIIGAFARRAYRRPVTTEEVARLTALAEAAWGRGEGFEPGVRVALKAVLVSPQFLFRETGRGQTGVTVIDEHALAARLSYFLWSSMPDAALFAEAERGTLRRNLEAQVRRMLADSRARALVDNFAGQWLEIRRLDSVAPDPRRFPGWDESLRVAMRKETELFFEQVVREDRSVLEFLDADWTFVNDRLARHYGLPGIEGDHFRRVSLAGTPRRGVLTHASVLTITSNPTRTSPVKRGKWVLEALLNAPPPPPPPNVPDLKDGKELKGTLRERMEQHRADPVCSSCHARMDPLGFGLESFDAIGAFREKENDLPIDASGRLVSGESFRGPTELVAVLAKQKRDAFVRALAAKVLTYAVGRGVEYFDKCALDQITANLARGGYKLSTLVLEVARSAPFQMTRGEEPPSVAAR